MGPIKAMILSLDAAKARKKLDKMLADPPKDFRATLLRWAQRQAIALN